MRIQGIMLLFVSALAVTAIVIAADGADAMSSACGDVDGNGTVAASDALRILQAAVGIPVEISCPVCVKCWDTNANDNCDEEEDLNGDGVCTELDCAA